MKVKWAAATMVLTEMPSTLQGMIFSVARNHVLGFGNAGCGRTWTVANHGGDGGNHGGHEDALHTKGFTCQALRHPGCF